MNRWCHGAVLTAMLSIPACTPHPLADPATPTTTTRADVPAAWAGSPVGSDADAADPPVAEAAPAPTGAIALRDAMALALRHSPQLAAYAWSVRAAEARALQAGLWPNPELAVEVENIAGSGRLSGVDAAETTVGLAQTFPLGGDVARRQALAAQRTELANWDYEAARLAVLLEVTQRFVAALAADRRLALAEEALELAEATQRVTEGRVAAGEASPVEQMRVAVPVVTAEVALRRAVRQREAAYRRLALTWAGEAATFERVQGDLASLAPVPEAAALVRLVSDNPAVARWATEISARLAERRLAEAEAIPDLTGAVGVKHFNEDDEAAVVVGVSLPLPLFDRRQGDVLAARLEASSARQRQRDAERRLQAMLSAAYAELAGAYDEATALRDRALPAAERAFDATQRAFNAGKLPLLDVLDAQRTLFELRQRYLDALVTYHLAAAEIESLIGQRLTEVGSPDAEAETDVDVDVDVDDERVPQPLSSQGD